MPVLDAPDLIPHQPAAAPDLIPHAPIAPDFIPHTVDSLLSKSVAQNHRLRDLYAKKNTTDTVGGFNGSDFYEPTLESWNAAHRAKPRRGGFDYYEPTREEKVKALQEFESSNETLANAVNEPYQRAQYRQHAAEAIAEQHPEANTPLSHGISEGARFFVDPFRAIADPSINLDEEAEADKAIQGAFAKKDAIGHGISYGTGRILSPEFISTNLIPGAGLAVNAGKGALAMEVMGAAEDLNAGQPITPGNVVKRGVIGAALPVAGAAGGKVAGAAVQALPEAVQPIARAAGGAAVSGAANVGIGAGESLAETGHLQTAREAGEQFAVGAGLHVTGGGAANDIAEQRGTVETNRARRDIQEYDRAQQTTEAANKAMADRAKAPDFIPKESANAGSIRENSGQPQEALPRQQASEEARSDDLQRAAQEEPKPAAAAPQVKPREGFAVKNDKSEYEVKPLTAPEFIPKAETVKAKPPYRDKPQTASDILVRHGVDDGLFPNDFELTADDRAALPKDAFEGLNRSEKQTLRDMVSEDRNSDVTASMNAEQKARYEQGVRERYGANKEQRKAQAIKHYLNSPDANLQKLAVYADAEGTGPKTTRKVDKFNDGDEFDIGDRHFVVRVDTDGNVHFEDHDVTIAYADGDIKYNSGSLKKGNEFNPNEEFAPVTKTTGAQGSLLGERYEGSGIGSKTGSMFGDMRQDEKHEPPRGEDAKIAEKFRDTKSGDLAFGPGAAAESDPTFRPEATGAAPTPENAPKVIATTLSPEAHVARQADSVGAFLRGKLGESVKKAPQAARDAYNAIADSVRRYAQQTFPALHRGHTEAGDAAARLISSREVIKYTGDAMSSKVLDLAGEKQGSDFDRKLGAVMVEDQLKGIRAKFEKRAADPNLPEKERADAAEAAKNVKTIIGAPDSPFKTEADYRAALDDAKIQSAIAAHRQFVEPTTEGNFRESARINPEEIIPTRGGDTNSFISLKAIREADQDAHTQLGLKSGGNVKNTIRKHSPFEREAMGNAKQYELNYSDLVNHSIERGTLPAAQARLYRSLEDGGLAVRGRNGAQPTIDGKPTIAINLEFKPNEKLYVRSDVATEVRRALNIDQADKPFELASKITTQIALASGVEGIAHAANHFAVLMKSPIKGEHLPTWLANVPGVKAAAILDSVGTNAFRMWKGKLETKEHLSELANLGALKPSYEQTEGIRGKLNPARYMGKAIDHLATASRLAMDDGWKMMADKGIVQDTPQARRDYLNQLGQYHKEAQSALVRVARNTVGPFATAGSTFYTQGIRTLGLSTGAKASSTANAAKLRGYVLAQLGGTLAMVGIVNYLRSGQIQPTGTPWGSLYLGKKDDKPSYIDIADIIGAKRGTRALGLDSAIQGKLENKTNSQIADKAMRQSESAAISPFAGPLASFGVTALSGKSAHGLQDEAEKAQPGEVQGLKNLKAAAKNLNPTVGLISEGIEQDKTGWEHFTSQLGKFGPHTGKAPDKVAKSPAESLAKEINTRDLGPMTADEKEKSKLKRDIITGLRSTNREERLSAVTKAKEAQSAGKIDKQDIARIVDRVSLGELGAAIKHESAEDVVKVWAEMNADERKQHRDAVAQKIKNSRLPDEKKVELWKQVK